MNTIYLTDEEKKNAVHWLSQSANGGGWFFALMTIFPMGMLLSAWLRIIPTAVEWDGSMYGVLIGWLVIFSLLAAWLFRQKRKVAVQLSKPLQPATAVISQIHVIPYAGWRMRLQINTVDGEQIGHIRVIVKPSWQVGEQIEVLMLDDGRFFPRHLSQGIDFGRIETPQRRIRTRVLVGCGGALFFALALTGFLLGFYGQG